MSSYFVRISLGDFHTNHEALTLWGCNYKVAPFRWADIFLCYFGANVLRVCIYKFAYRWLYNKVILLIITVQIYQGENLAKILIPAHLKLTEILTDLWNYHHGDLLDFLDCLRLAERLSKALDLSFGRFRV